MKRVIVDKKIAHGEPVIQGTRIPVAVVIGALADGMTFDQVMREYDLTQPDIKAALKYALDLIKEEEDIPLRKIS
ncbi:MAG: DUF433 domain-containing protein [Actinobacteria bacterium]|nr:DUF433 domain-containing protein [Actinomycetota bacterium]